MPRRYGIVISRHRAIQSTGQEMKKNRDASELAARIAAAASQPAGTSSAPAASASPQPVTPSVSPQPNKKAKADVSDTVPITLRPNSALLNKYVLKASERTREEGRVVSAQQIMLEALERGDA
jgi:cell pole-organizing protein PopZ